MGLSHTCEVVERMRRKEGPAKAKPAREGHRIQTQSRIALPPSRTGEGGSQADDQIQFTTCWPNVEDLFFGLSTTRAAGQPEGRMGNSDEVRRGDHENIRDLGRQVHTLVAAGRSQYSPKADGGKLPLDAKG